MDLIKMKSIAAYRLLRKNKQNLAPLLGVFTGFLFLVLIFTAIVIVKISGNGKSLAAANNASLSFTWLGQAHYVTFAGPRYSDGSTTTAFCSSTNSNSCTVPAYTFQGGATLLYTVKVQDGNGAIVKSGTTTAYSCFCTSAGSATMDWSSWVYSMAVYPVANGNCLAVVADCKSGTTTGTSFTATGLKDGTTYQETVCLPDCGSASNTVVYSNQATTPAAPNPTPAPAACNVQAVAVNAGGTITVNHGGFAAGESIRLFGTAAQLEMAKTIASTGALQPQLVQVPINVPAGVYSVVIVTQFPVVQYTCGGGSVTVNASPIPSCIFDLSSVGVGGQIKLWGQNGANGQVNMQYVLNGIPGAVTSLNATLATSNNSSSTAVAITIPSSTIAGLYVVRIAVASIAITCKSVANTDLTVTAAITVSGCTIRPKYLATGQSMLITHGGFAAGESIRLFGISGGFDTKTVTQDSTHALVTQTIIVPDANSGGDYNIVVVTRFPDTLTTCAGGPIKVTVLNCNLADVDHDGVVTDSDMQAINSAMGAKYGASNYNAAYDFNQDLVINSSDLFLAARYRGQTCPVTTVVLPPIFCGIKSLPVVAGQALVVSYSGFAAGESIVISTPTPTELGKTNPSTTALAQTTVVIPATLPAGVYNILVNTRFPITSKQYRHG